MMKRVLLYSLLCFVGIFYFQQELRAENLTKIVKPNPKYGKLSVHGTNLVDESGNIVQIKGVSLGWHNWWPRFYTDETISWLKKDWNCELVRAAIGVDIDKGYLKAPTESLDKLYTVVDAAIENGMYVIVDWHSHTLYTKEAIDFFRTVVQRYKGVPNVIYEIYNEPVEDSWADIKKYAIDVITNIRALDKDAVILVGCPHWDQDIHLVADDPIENVSNVMYTVHFYAATHKQYLRDRTDYAIRKGIPIFISECAGMEASGDGPVDYEEWRKWRQWMDKNNLSWVAWSLSDKYETCSMIKDSTIAISNWKEDDLKPWGRHVKKELQIEGSNKISLDVTALDDDYIFVDTDEIILQAKLKNRLTKNLDGFVKYTLLKDSYELVQKDSVATTILANDSLKSDPFFFRNVKPGFYRVNVSFTSTEGHDLQESFVVGNNPELISSPNDEAADFNSFWKTALQELATVKPNYKLTLIPEKSNTDYDMFLVQMHSLDDELITGYYAKPKAKGKHPVIVEYMGYGSKPYFPNTSWDGFAYFVLSVRGQALNESTNRFGTWLTYGLGDKDNYYYRGAFMDVVRAIDFVSSRSEIDAKKIAVRGSSQGGAFSVVAAALDKRVKVVVTGIPFLSDYKDYFAISPWPKSDVDRFMKENPAQTWDAVYHTLSYFDIKNMASRITVPLLMGIGVQDDVCPGHINFAMYNQVKSKKAWMAFPRHAHSTGDEFYRNGVGLIKQVFNGK